MLTSEKKKALAFTAASIGFESIEGTLRKEPTEHGRWKYVYDVCESLLSNPCPKKKRVTLVSAQTFSLEEINEIEWMYWSDFRPCADNPFCREAA